MEQHELSLFFFRSNARCAQHQFIMSWSSWSVVVPTFEIKNPHHRTLFCIWISFVHTTYMWHYAHQREENHNKSSPLYTDVPVQTKQMLSITTISKVIMCSNQKLKCRLFRVVIGQNRLEADILKFSCNITNIAFRVRSLSEGCCISVSNAAYFDVGA